MTDIVDFEEILQVLEGFLDFDEDCVCEIDQLSDGELDTLTSIIAEILIEEKKRGSDENSGVV